MATHKDLSQQRRETLRPCLNKDYKALCNQSLNFKQFFNEFLLGEDLAKRAEETVKGKKMTNKMTVPNNGAQRGRFFSQGRPPMSTYNGKGYNQCLVNHNRKRQGKNQGLDPPAKHQRRE